MEQKQVIIVALLVIAIILSTASVMMGVSMMKTIQITEAPTIPQRPDLAIKILPTPENTGEIIQT